jgi:hypothetical protein
MPIALPAGMVPLRNPSTEDILYGDRETTYRYEVLTHSTSTGLDSLAGTLDGVTKASLQWAANAAVKGSGTVSVLDLETAKPGMLRISDLDLVTARIRPVLTVTGLPEIPLGVYVITAAPEDWSDTGHVYNLEVHDKSTVLDQEQIDATFTADTSTPVLQIVQAAIASSGEHIDVDLSDTRTLSAPLVWAPGDQGSSILGIVNTLLDALSYNSLTVSGAGDFQATPYVRPAVRSIRYDILNLDRELVDGEQSIYLPDWSTDRDSYGVPNEVITVAEAGADAAPLTGRATNEDPASPYSYQARGRWITSTITGVDVPDGTTAAQTAFLNDKARQSLIASSSPQASRQVKHLPLPLAVLDVLRFASTPAGIDARHTVQSLQLECTPTGLMTSTLQEVVDL